MWSSFIIVKLQKSEKLNMMKASLVYIGVSSNGRTEAFEAFNRGSNPCTPAFRRYTPQCLRLALSILNQINHCQL